MSLFGFTGKAQLHQDWLVLEDEAQLQALRQASASGPVAIFKHSTRCGISAAVKRQLDKEWNFNKEELTLYYLDLLRFRNISSLVAEELGVGHESPQLIVLVNNEVIYQASHSSIDLVDVAASLPRAG